MSRTALDDFSLKDVEKDFMLDLIKRYRRYVYEASAIDRPDKMQAKVIDDKVVAKERKKDFEISRISRFRHRPAILRTPESLDQKNSCLKTINDSNIYLHSKHE